MIGVGLIGCGNIAETYLRLAPRFRGFEVRAVADIDPGAAHARARAFGLPAMTVDELMRDPAVGIVLNLTVPSAHYAVSRAALQAGKHVYSEKPLTLSLREARALARMAEGRGLRIGAAPDTFLGAAGQAARAAIDGGRIGQVVSGTAHVLSGGMEDWHPNPAFFYRPGGGPVLDMGPYYITQLVQLLGPVRRVAALASTGRRRRRVGSGPRAGEEFEVSTPTTLLALLDFASGTAVTLSASWDVRAHRHGHMELYGTEGTVFLPDPNWFDGAVEIDDGQGGRGILPAANHPFARVNHPADTPDCANYRGAGLADMAQAITQDRPHRCGLELATHVVDVMTSIHRAGDSGRVVTLRSTCRRPDPLPPAEAARLMH